MNALLLTPPHDPSPRSLAALRDVDWLRTSIGRPQSWPPSWRLAMEACLAASEPILVAFGPDLELFCNDRFADLVNGGDLLCFRRRMRALGGDFQLEPVCGMLTHVARTGEPLLLLNVSLAENRQTKLAGRQIGLSFAPLRDRAGRPTGATANVMDISRSPEAVCRLAHLHELVAARERCGAEARKLGALGTFGIGLE
jgi:hypothetical protein